MRLLIVDPNLSVTSPSMKGIVRSLPALKERGWEIEAWCWTCDAGLQVDRIIKLPRLGNMHTLYGYAFSVWARLRAWWKFAVKHEPRPDVIYSVGWYLPACDVAHVHFSHWDWERRQRQLGTKSLRDVYERLTNLLGMAWANRFLRKTTARTVLSVSNAVAGDLRAVNSNLNVKVLPNCYDPKRFNSAVRAEFGEPMRAKMGFSKENIVFVFVSAGHYRRKGFFLAVDAVATLRKSQPGVKLLVVGGQAERVTALQEQLDARQPAWREFITFTGMVSDVENYFAASDAFLFPSYSEAFALVEVEAAACGLPLFLTRHHGSEMIMEDGVNGRFVEFDAVQIASVLGDFVRGEWRPKHSVNVTRSLDSEAYAERFCDELAAVCGAGNDRNRVIGERATPLLMPHS